MRKSRLTTLAVAAILLAVGVGAAAAESGDDSSGFWEVGEHEECAATEANPSDSGEAPRATSGRESDARDSDTDEWSDEDSDADEWSDEDWEPVEWESDEGFFDRCHGVVSCTFTLVGEVIALPFRILGGVFRFIF